MRHRNTADRVRRLALGLPLALLLAAPAAADPPEKPERRILLHDHREMMVRRNPLQYLDLTDKGGISYRRSLVVNGRQIRFKIYGPVQRGGYGLGIKIKF